MEQAEGKNRADYTGASCQHRMCNGSHVKTIIFCRPNTISDRSNAHFLLINANTQTIHVHVGVLVSARARVQENQLFPSNLLPRLPAIGSCLPSWDHCFRMFFFSYRLFNVPIKCYCYYWAVHRLRRAPFGAVTGVTLAMSMEANPRSWCNQLSALADKAKLLNALEHA